LKYDTEAFKATLHYSGSKAILSVMGTTMATVLQVGAAAPYPVKEGDMLPLLVNWHSLSEKLMKGLRHSPSTSARVPLIETVTLGALEPTESTPSTRENPILAHLAKAAGKNLDPQVPDIANSHALSKLLQGLKFGKFVWSRFDLTLYATIFGGLGRREARSSCFMVLFDDALQEFTRVLQYTAGGRRCFFTDDGSFGLWPFDYAARRRNCRDNTGLYSIHSPACQLATV
jgi:hypothetical protein